jgi:hypothetical protein
MSVEPGKPSPSAGSGRQPGITVLADEEIRRDLEQRALRNSRALVDKLEQEETKDRKLQRRATWAFLIVAALCSLALLFVSINDAPTPPVVFPKPGLNSPK